MNKYDHLSYSSISKYISCPAQFNFYMNNKKALPSDPALAGNERHAEIAKHLVLGTMDQAKFGERMKKFCRHILKVPDAVEHDFALDFITNTVIGKIDAYSVQESQAVIVDWKSFPGFSEELQLKIYAMAIKERYPEVEIIHTYFFYTGPDYYETYTYFMDDLQRFSNELSQTIDAISVDEKFEPRPGQHCGRCNYVNHCPIAKNFEIIKIENANDVIEMAKKTYAAEALVDTAKEKIKAWIIDNGLEALPVGDGRYFLSSSTTMRQGKFKSEKDKLACQKALELATAVASIPESAAPETVATVSPANETGTAENIVAFDQNIGDKKPKIRMSDLAELLKRLGKLDANATSAEASTLIKELMGTNFIVATDEQKLKLKTELESELLKKAS